MTDAATFDAWDAGYSHDGVPDPGAPEPVAPPSVTPGVTPAVIHGVTRDGGEAVTPTGGEPVTPLIVGQWDEMPGDAGTERDGGLGAVLARLAGLAKGSPLLGASGLAAEVADPHPGTWQQHWRHVTSHEALPAGTWHGIGFVAGHLAVTGPLKLAGKAMTVTGNALTWTGQRTDRASDHFTSAAIFIALAAAMAGILVIAAGAALSYLP